jgi:hypothetical protein
MRVGCGRYVMHPKPAQDPISESVQRELFGLFKLATSGPPPKLMPVEGTEEELQQWKAWTDAPPLGKVRAFSWVETPP